MWAKWALLLLSFTAAKCDMSYLNFLQYENYTVPDVDTICSYFHTATNVSELCGTQLEILCRNATLLMTAMDASSKFPYAGLGFSSRMDYGNFDQCMTIDHKYQGGRILGEHCTYGLILPDIFSNSTDSDSLYKLAVCKPNGCKASDYNAIVEDLLGIPLPFFVDVGCQTKESNSNWTTGDIIVVALFGFIGALMVISTVYDIYLYKTENESVHPLLISFSVLTNGRKLLHISKHSTSKEQIEVFHGMRVISMMWVVAGHGMGIFGYSAVVNIDKVNQWQKEMYSMYISAAPLAVDTFFFMSGFLLAFQYFKGRSRGFVEQTLDVPRIIIHRYLRLTPALVMVFLVVLTFYHHMGSGPLWSLIADDYVNLCKTNWWKLLLYIQNYDDMTKMCLPQTWYLSADMQMFVLSPLIMIPLSLQMQRLSFRTVMLEMLVFYVLYTGLILGIKFIFRDYSNDFDTHTRVINYFLGLWMGLFMRLKINEPFLHMVPEKWRSLLNKIAWVVVILGMIALVVCYQDQNLHHGWTSRTAFDVLMRPAWSIALSWMTYSCYHGHGGFVTWILCRPLFQVLGRLTYCIYLIHMIVIMYYLGTTRTKSYFTDYNAFYLFCGHYIVSVIVATSWTLAFESPLIIIEKYLLGNFRKSKESTVPQSTSQTKSPNVLV